MTVAAEIYGPPLSGGSTTLPVVLDGTGKTTVVPLLIENGKNLSGVEVQVTGTAPSGFLLRDSGGLLVGSFGYAVNANNDWVSGSNAGDVVITGTGRALMRPLGGFNITNPGGAVCSVNSEGSSGLTLSCGSYSRMYLASNGITIDSAGGLGAGNLLIQSGAAGTGGASYSLQTTATWSPSSGATTFRAMDVAYTVNQTGSASGAPTGIFLNATETAVLGTHNLLDLQIGSTSQFKVDNKGGFQCASAALATSATVGLPRLRTCAGTPSGAVADGSVMLDTTALKIWVRMGGVWKQTAALT